MVNRQLKAEYQVNYLKATAMCVLKQTRDYLHVGHTLLTHPLAGSVKPNETPYRSVMVTTMKAQLDLKSVSVIEASIATYEKLAPTPKAISPAVLADFEYIDYSLIKSAIESASR